MTTNAAQDRAARRYREDALLTAPRERIVHALLERAVRELGELAVELGDPERRRGARAGERIGRVHDIVAELRAALDIDAGGQLAGRLDALYEFCLDRLAAANAQRTPVAARDVARVLGELEEAWRDVELD
ncbi:MAG: flagellar protein FliS [Planctomycetes bacterium]|nr:flagellar protein FliS [Planctomycetota bacterium]